MNLNDHMPDRPDNDERGLTVNGLIPGAGQCVADGCGAPCPEDALMCRSHWRAVPPGVKDNMRFVFGRWRRDDATLMDIRDAQWACVKSLRDG